MDDSIKQELHQLFPTRCLLLKALCSGQGLWAATVNCRLGHGSCRYEPCKREKRGHNKTA